MHRSDRWRILSSWVLLAGLALPTPARAWSRLGHATVALVAEGLMTPAARQMVDELRRADGWAGLKPGDSDAFPSADEDLEAFCRGPRGGLGRVASWADAWQVGHRDTRPWHNVFTPVDGPATTEALEQACGDGCILTRLRQSLAVLLGPSTDRKAKLAELLWACGLVADLHLPLNCADHQDFGGQSDNVFFKHKAESLYAVWDSSLLLSAHAKAAELAQDLLAHECQDVPDVEGLDPDSPLDWARESFAVAKDFVYPQARRLQGAFTQADADEAWRVERRQLARAGVRLAFVLNAAADHWRQPPAQE